MKPEYIVIHHSLTKDGATVSWSAIREYHMVTNHWSDIGYHWGVELIGSHYEMIVGRTMNDDGAHCKEANMNRKGVGICLIGNFDLSPPPLDQLKAACRLVAWIMDWCGIPQERIIGHRDAGMMNGYDWKVGQYKSCPGSQFDMDYFKGLLPPFTR